MARRAYRVVRTLASEHVGPVETIERSGVVQAVARLGTVPAVATPYGVAAPLYHDAVDGAAGSLSDRAYISAALVPKRG